jgi:hypothetical protein
VKSFADVSEDRSVSILRVNQSMKTLSFLGVPLPGFGDSTLVRNVGNYLGVNTSSGTSL